MVIKCVMHKSMEVAQREKKNALHHLLRALRSTAKCSSYTLVEQAVLSAFLLDRARRKVDPIAPSSAFQPLDYYAVFQVSSDSVAL